MRVRVSGTWRTVLITFSVSEACHTIGQNLLSHPPRNPSVLISRHSRAIGRVSKSLSWLVFPRAIAAIIVGSEKRRYVPAKLQYFLLGYSRGLDLYAKCAN